MYALLGGLVFGVFGRGLPGTTHCALLQLITSRLPVMDEIVKRMVAFVQKCLLSDCELVSYALCHVGWTDVISSR